MDQRRRQRQEEHHQNLRMNAAADFSLAQTYLPHDAEALPILVALGNLLVVDDQDHRHDEQRAEEQTHEQQPAVKLGQLLSKIDLIFDPAETDGAFHIGQGLLNMIETTQNGVTVVGGQVDEQALHRNRSMTAVGGCLCLDDLIQYGLILYDQPAHRVDVE